MRQMGRTPIVSAGPPVGVRLSWIREDLGANSCPPLCDIGENAFLPYASPLSFKRIFNLRYVMGNEDRS